MAEFDHACLYYICLHFISTPFTNNYHKVDSILAICSTSASYSVRQTAIARLLPTLGKSNSVAGRPIAGKLKTNSWKLKRKQTFPKFGSFSLPVGICPGGFSFQSFVQFRVFFWNANPRILEIFAPPQKKTRMVASEKGIWGLVVSNILSFSTLFGEMIQFD